MPFVYLYSCLFFTERSFGSVLSNCASITFFSNLKVTCLRYEAFEGYIMKLVLNNKTEHLSNPTGKYFNNRWH